MLFSYVLSFSSHYHQRSFGRCGDRCGGRCFCQTQQRSLSLTLFTLFTLFAFFAFFALFTHLCVDCLCPALTICCLTSSTLLRHECNDASLWILMALFATVLVATALRHEGNDASLWILMAMFATVLVAYPNPDFDGFVCFQAFFAEPASNPIGFDGFLGFHGCVCCVCFVCRRIYIERNGTRGGCFTLTQIWESGKRPLYPIDPSTNDREWARRRFSRRCGVIASCRAFTMPVSRCVVESLGH